MNLIPFLIMKAAKDSQKRGSKGSSQSSKHNSSSKKNPSRSKSYLGSKPSYRLTNEVNSLSSHRLSACIYNLISEKPEYSTALEQFMQNIKEQNEKRISELYSELESLCEPSKRISEAYDKTFEDAFSKLPFFAKRTSDPHSDFGELWYVVPNPNAPHASFHTAAQTLTLDGVIFTKSEFDANKNPFKSTYDSQLMIHEDYKEKYESMRSEIEKIEKQKFRLKLSSKLRSKLESLKTEFIDVEATYIKMTGYLKNAQIFDNLTESEREKIGKFFETQSEFKKLHEKVYGCRERCLAMEGYGKTTTVQDLLLKSKTEAYEMLSPEQKTIIDEIPETISNEIVALSDEDFTKFASGSFPASSIHQASSIFYDIADLTISKVKEKYNEKIKSERETEKQSTPTQPE